MFFSLSNNNSKHLSDSYGSRKGTLIKCLQIGVVVWFEIDIFYNRRVAMESETRLELRQRCKVLPPS